MVWTKHSRTSAQVSAGCFLYFFPTKRWVCSTSNLTHISNMFAARTEGNTLCSGPEAGGRVGDDCCRLDLCWHELLLHDISVVIAQKLPIGHQVTHALAEESIGICCLGSAVTNGGSGLSLTGMCCIFRNIFSEIFFLLPFFPYFFLIG